jgi:hypothetical protein
MPPVLYLKKEDFDARTGRYIGADLNNGPNGSVPYVTVVLPEDIGQVYIVDDLQIAGDLVVARGTVLTVSGNLSAAHISAVQSIETTGRMTASTIYCGNSLRSPQILARDVTVGKDLYCLQMNVDDLTVRGRTYADDIQQLNPAVDQKLALKIARRHLNEAPEVNNAPAQTNGNDMSIANWMPKPEAPKPSFGNE